MMSSWLALDKIDSGGGTITHHAFALDLAFGTFLPCAQWTSRGFRLLIKQVQAVTSLAITFFDVWALRMLSICSAQWDGLCTAGYSCVQTKFAVSSGRWGILGTTSCYRVRFLVRSDLHSPLDLQNAADLGRRNMRHQRRTWSAACMFTNVAADPPEPRISIARRIQT